MDIATAPLTCPEDNFRNIVAVATGNHRARLNAEAATDFPGVQKRLREVLSDLLRTMQICMPVFILY